MKNQALRLAFAGTPEFGATILASLIANGRHTISAVYTQPDRHAGRGRRPSESAVKQLAVQARLPVHQPANATELETSDALAGIDVLVVIAYGMLLSSGVLGRPRLGCVNVHPSMLPRWRGAAPIPRAIEAGDTMTGVSIMLMDAGLDTGDVLVQRGCAILPDDTAGTLGTRLALMGGECLAEALDALSAGTAVRTRQEDAHATYARKITKDELQIDWTRPAREIERSIRAFNPEPLAHARMADTDMLLWQALALPTDGADARPGTVLSASAGGIDIMTGDGVLRVLTLQLPGKRPISAADFVNARPQWKRGA